MKTKNKSTPPLTPKSALSIPTTIESETPVTTPYASTTSSSKLRVEDLEMISIKDNKIDKLTKQVTILEQMLCKAQSCNLIATNKSELLKMEVDKLKQYSRRFCLVMFGVEVPPNKSTESAEEKVCRIIETNLDISREDFDYELDKVHRLPPNNKSSDKKKKKQHANLQIKKDILNITNEKGNFHVNLTKYRSDLLHGTNT